MKQKILVVEDDASILTGLVDLLDGEGYRVIFTKDGKEALIIHEKERPDLILLDIMIPEKSGYDVCREIRKKDAMTPIIMLTAKGEEIDKVVGLETGADDYIVKPFTIRELLARVRAALRRANAKPERKKKDGPVVFGDVVIDPKTLKGRKGKKEFPVSLREVQLLQLFFERKGEALDRFTLLEEIWGIKYQGTTRTLDQHIVKLRQKIEDDPSSPKFLITVHGVGYKFIS